MATYTELHDQMINPDVLKRVKVALLVSITDMLEAGSHTVLERKWMKVALYDPTGEAQKAWNYILADNRAATLTQITGASDEQLQTQVNAIVGVLVSAMNNA